MKKSNSTQSRKSVKREFNAQGRKGAESAKNEKFLPQRAQRHRGDLSYLLLCVSVLSVVEIH